MVFTCFHGFQCFFSIIFHGFPWFSMVLQWFLPISHSISTASQAVLRLHVHESDRRFLARPLHTMRRRPLGLLDASLHVAIVKGLQGLEGSKELHLIDSERFRSKEAYITLYACIHRYMIYDIYILCMYNIYICHIDDMFIDRRSM